MARQAVVVGNIGLEGDGLDAVGAAGGRGFLGFGLAAGVVDHDVAAAFRQQDRRGGAHAGGRAGNDGDLVVALAPCT